MAQKKPVGKQPICSEYEMRRIDPVWLFRSVPKGFWLEPKNRHNYLLWLVHKLGFRRLQDLYRLTHNDIASHRGGGLANAFWHGSPVHAVKECFPHHDWQEWCFVQVPTAFWRSRGNRRRYMTWLGEQLGVQQWQDWYRVTTKDFQNHRGGSLLLKYRSSVSATVMACFPERDWKEWMFARVPTNLWNDRKTCRRYLMWLGKRLGYRCLDDWYRVKHSDFKVGGRTLMRNHHESASAVVIDLIPRRQWCEWMFTRVPPGFWDRTENRRRYFQWLGKRLGYRRQEDWHQVRRKDFYENYGGSLLVMYQPVWDLLEECFPQWDWEPYRRQSLSIEQVLSWADAHFAEHGEWPSQNSGAIVGTEETWATIASTLRGGCRGLPGKTTLARLLSQHRGVRSPKHLPALTEQQILDWAQAHFRVTGHWPNSHSSAVVKSNLESWAGIDSALRRGTRGLPGDSSVAKLLQKHGFR